MRNIEFANLEQLYEALGQSEFNRSHPTHTYRLPDARDLYWDEPDAESWRKCIDSASALFHYLSHAVKA